MKSRKKKIFVEPSPANKCSRKFCPEPSLPASIWCREHQSCGPNVACDNLPAVETCDIN